MKGEKNLQSLLKRDIIMTRQKRKYAIVDLEATSAGSNAKIIQVGIVIIEDGRITQSYETDVNPHERLDEHIKQLTGLTDARLKKAPVCTSGKRNF